MHWLVAPNPPGPLQLQLTPAGPQKVAGEPLQTASGPVSVHEGRSDTSTVNEQLAEFPQSSVAVQVTVVVPTGNVLPDGGTQTMVGVWSQLSVAVAVYVCVLWQTPTSMLPGQVMTGGSLSS